MIKRTAVLAGTYNEFAKYARNRPKQRLVFCDRCHQFSGIEFSDVVEIGTFRSRPDALDIYQCVMPMVRKK